MRVLHLFSNAKWTGPAEPALNLCAALRRKGVEADFACAPDAGKSHNMVAESARKLGLEPILRFHLKKHRHPLKNAADRRRLRLFLSERPYDLVHCHLDNDHLIASGAIGEGGLPIVRSSYCGDGLPLERYVCRALDRTAWLIEPSRMALETNVERFSYPAERMTVVPGAVDTARFDPGRDLPDMRARLGIPREAFVAGIVARMQTHRRFEDLFEAFRMLIARRPDAHLVIVGRGTNQAAVGWKPVEEQGLADRVHFTGYVQGDEYVGALAAFDVKVFLVPGSDGTCRAVRETMAMGKPAVVAQRGMLPEIVTEGEDGYVFDNTPEDLAKRLIALAERPAYRRRLGEAARRTASTRYSLPAQAQAVAEVYRRVLAED